MLHMRLSRVEPVRQTTGAPDCWQRAPRRDDPTGPGRRRAASAAQYGGQTWARVLLLCGLAIGLAHAETPFVNDAEMGPPSSVKEGRKWQEESVRMPPWPRDADLVEVKLDHSDTAFRHFIDTKSLSTGGDGVVRYTLVAESDSGARNVSFEGLRCTPKGKYKTYAYGAGSRFTPTSIAEDWRPVDERAGDRLHFELWKHYLCVPRLFQPRPKKDQVRILKSGRVPAIENSGFLTN